MSGWRRSIPRPTMSVRRARDEDLESTLLVFGYQCKLFRDDERATYVDQGRHLIPWMGDTSVMIDRYDGRGHLHDLGAPDPERAPLRGEEIEEEVQRVEALCEEERYLELHTDISLKQMYEEEELKRLNEAISDGYSAVGFNYNASGSETAQANELKQEEEEEEEEPYYAPPELQLPTDVLPPSTVKQHAIVEKTALFVSKQGAQMEIMIKTKQKDNPQFEFLEFGTALNPYYKHLVKMLKSGKYQPRGKQQASQRQSGNEDYLHPSLSRKSEAPVVAKPQTREEFINSVSSKLPSGQIENTMYAALLNNLSRHTGRDSPKLQDSRRSRNASPVAPSGYSQYEHVEQSRMDGYPPQAYPQEYPPGTYDYQYEEADVNKMGMLQPPVPGMEPVRLPSTDMHSSNGQPVLTGNGDQSLHLTKTIVDYGEPEVVHGPHIMPPPPDIQAIIDKMAVYVCKNGPEFEIIVRKKHDERFDFLNAGHVHNAYYEHKKTLYQQEIAETRQSETTEVSRLTQRDSPQYEDTDDSNDSGHQNKNYNNKGISFSLRSKEVESLPPALRATALLYESSTDDEAEENSATADNADGTSLGQVLPPAEWIQSQVKESQEGASATNTTTAPTVTRQAAIDLAVEKTQARLQDKLALAARAKLAQTSKENHMRAERKRKAAMFINMLKGSQPPPTAASTTTSVIEEASEVIAEESPDPGPTEQESIIPIQSSPESNGQTASPQLSAHPSPAHSASMTTVSTATGLQSSQSPPNHHHSETHTKSRSKSRSKSPRKRRSRSPVRKRSASPAVWHRSRSRSRSPKRRRGKDSGLPSSYSIVRRSVSPVKKRRSRSRSRTPERYKVVRRSRSRSKEKSSRSRSKRSRSRSKLRAKSPSRSRKRSRSKTRSKKSNRSRSRKRSRSRSRTRSKKSKSKKSTKSPSRSPKKKKSHGDERRSDKEHSGRHSSSTHRGKHGKSKKSKRQSSSGSEGEEEDSPIIHHIEDSPSPPITIHQDGGIISDSSGSFSSPEREVPASSNIKPRIPDKPDRPSLPSIPEVPPSRPAPTSIARSPTAMLASSNTDSLHQRRSAPTTTKHIRKPPPAPSIDMFAE